ncbi:MAG TPA: hypothetical protein VJU61_05640, partial [Polyangiaceae bacterium]|nr:hypothetical protein [Polyangiaceae bacterium]
MTTLIGGSWNDFSPRPCVSIRGAEPAPVPVRRPVDVSIRHCVQLGSWPTGALSAFELGAVTAGAGVSAAPVPEP